VLWPTKTGYNEMDERSDFRRQLPVRQMDDLHRSRWGFKFSQNRNEMAGSSALGKEHFRLYNDAKTVARRHHERFAVTGANSIQLAAY
jgi:hypothetical protein